MNKQRSALEMWSWAMYDWANAGFNTLVQTFVFAAYFAKSVAANETLGTAEWGNMMGVAGLFIGIGGPILGAIADRSGRRKPWIGWATGLCIVTTALLWFIKPDPQFALMALVLVCLGTIGSESANVFYNAMLPDLVPRNRIGRWSGWGWAMGYAGGIICLVLALFGFITDGSWFSFPKGELEHVRATTLLSAGWYLLFCIPMFLFTKDAPATGVPMGQAIGQAWGQLRDSIKKAREYKNVGLFLLARMLYNDGLITIFAFGGIYAAGTFGMKPDEVILFGIALNITAGLGSAGFAWLDDWIGPRKTILVSLLGLLLCSACTLFATTKLMFWIFGLLLGIFVGPVQASSRSYLARTAPAEYRNQFFGLFALSGKLTSFIGPLLVGRLTLAFDSQRAGMSAVLLLFILGFGLMLVVPRAINNTPQGE